MESFSVLELSKHKKKFTSNSLSRASVQFQRICECSLAFVPFTALSVDWLFAHIGELKIFFVEQFTHSASLNATQSTKKGNNLKICCRHL